MNGLRPEIEEIALACSGCRRMHWLMHHRTWILYRVSILVIVAVSQETVKLSLKVDAATTKAHGLQDTRLLACGSTSS